MVLFSCSKQEKRFVKNTEGEQVLAGIHICRNYPGGDHVHLIFEGVGRPSHPIWTEEGFNVFLLFLRENSILEDAELDHLADSWPKDLHTSGAVKEDFDLPLRWGLFYDHGGGHPFYRNHLGRACSIGCDFVLEVGGSGLSLETTHDYLPLTVKRERYRPRVGSDFK